MKLRIARLGVLFAGIMGLLGVMTPSAQAVKVYTISFTGQATLSGGLGYPCTPLGTLNDCPPSPNLTPKPKPNGKPGLQVNYTPKGGNTRGFHFEEIPPLCVAEGVTVNKKPVTVKAPVEAGLCHISADGVVSGYCGLSTGTGAGFSTATSGGAFPAQEFTFTFKFTGIGGELLVQGTVTKAGHPTAGNLSAIVTAAPDPLAGSCTNKTTTRFIIVGNAQLQFKNGVLP